MEHTFCSTSCSMVAFESVGSWAGPRRRNEGGVGRADIFVGRVDVRGSPLRFNGELRCGGGWEIRGLARSEYTENAFGGLSPAFASFLCAPRLMLTLAVNGLNG